MKPAITFTLDQDLERLANLCGPLDGNLRSIERECGVTIRRRGPEFNLLGEASNTELVQRLLEELFARAQQALNSQDMRLVLTQLRQLPQDLNKPAPFKRLRISPRTANQAQYLQQINDSDVCFGIGPAGTGKTYLAVASAVDALERDLVQRLVVTRPAVEAGERLGFLPGDLAQKVDPYLRPLFDALYELLGMEKTVRMQELGIIEIAPLAFMRGRTLNNAFILLDEAQNTTTEQMKMFLTRIGHHSKMVVNGDITQIDLPRGQRSGLVQASEILDGVPGIAFTRFGAQDIVRHPLVARIVQAYEQHQGDPM